MLSITTFTIFTTLAGGLVCGIVGFLVCKLAIIFKDRKDNMTVLTYMQRLIPKETNWLPTSDIAKSTRLSYSRVEDICSRHPKITAIMGMGSPEWGLQDVSEEHAVARKLEIE